MVEVFISHSGEDSQLARQVVDLLKTSLNLRARQIRCTSVDGYRLPVGADTDEQLRKEVLSSRTFISILSRSSLSSVYVLFELGARWGAKQPLFPLLAPGLQPQSLRGPLTGLNALSCESRGQLHQFVSDVAEALDLEAELPAVYLGNIEEILSNRPSRGSRSASPQQEQEPSGAETFKDDPIGQTLASADDYSDAEQVIRRHCKNAYPDDYSMRNFCTKQQRKALVVLKQGRPRDIPEDVFVQVRNKCAAEYPEDHTMRQYCEKQQFDSYRELEGTSE